MADQQQQTEKEEEKEPIEDELHNQFKQSHKLRLME
jgi:hypothetical protein